MKFKAKNLITGEEIELDAIKEFDETLSADDWDDEDYVSFNDVDSVEFEVEMDDNLKDLIIDEEMEVPKCLH